LNSKSTGLISKSVTNTRNVNNAYGKKIRGKGTIAEMKTADSLELMKKLVVESFKQNPNSEAAKKLLQYENFTHNTNQLIDKAFLEGLKLAQRELITANSELENIREQEQYSQYIEQTETYNSGESKEKITSEVESIMNEDETSILYIADYLNIKPTVTELSKISETQMQGIYNDLADQFIKGKETKSIPNDMTLEEFVAKKICNV